MHNDKITISTHQLFAMFPDQETARTYLESRLWPKGVPFASTRATSARARWHGWMP